MGKDERLGVERGFKGILRTFLSSAKKHLKTGDREGLKARIDRTLRELYDMADWFRGRNYSKASKFIVKHARFMVTFSKLALEGVEIPYAMNRVERLMGEIKRC